MRIQFATGLARCGVCHHTIEKGLTELVGNLGTGRFESHYHLEPNEETNCKGFFCLHGFEKFFKQLVHFYKKHLQRKYDEDENEEGNFYWARLQELEIQATNSDEAFEKAKELIENGLADIRVELIVEQ